MKPLWITNAKIPIEEDSAVEPICPHCEKPVTKICCREVESFFGRRYMYYCPECRKVWGVSHRKGFWMG